MKFLIIDDEKDFAELLLYAIPGCYQVEMCNRGAEALDMILTQGDYDHIFCDLMMPGITGMDIFERLKMDGRGIEKRMIFMTGGAFTPRGIEFLKQIKNPRLEKPFSVNDFRLFVNSLAEDPISERQ
jgi:CheY-like chemotaxis protein